MTELRTNPLHPSWTETDHTLSPQAAERIRKATSENTRRAQRHDWDLFNSWCEEQGRTPLPATDRTLADYTAHLCSTLTGRGSLPSPATVSRALTSIGSVHALSGYAAPTKLANRVLKQYREERDAAGFRPRRAAVVTVPELARMADLAGDEVIGVRDRMLVLLAFSLMARRSEMCRIQVKDVVVAEHGLDVRIVRTKTDKQSAGQKIAVFPAEDPRVCPVAAVRAWLEVMAEQDITSGPLVRGVTSGGRIRDRAISAGTVDRVVKKLAAAAGVDKDVSGHTMRRSPVTLLVGRGVPTSTIAHRGGWSTRSHVVHDYVGHDGDRRVDLFGGMRLDTE